MDKIIIETNKINKIARDTFPHLFHLNLRFYEELFQNINIVYAILRHYVGEDKLSGSISFFNPQLTSKISSDILITENLDVAKNIQLYFYDKQYECL